MGPLDEIASEQARTEIAARITEIWTETIGRAYVDEHSDFYQEGGSHSLAPGMIRKINRSLGVELTEFDLEQARTIAKVTDAVYFQQTRADSSTVVPLRNFQGSRPPLFLVHGVGGNVLGFYSLAERLENSQPVYGIQAQALIPGKDAVLRLEKMAAQYIDDMRAACPEGPYHLLGFSFGGLVAFEIAQQMHASGLKVGLVGMLDTRQPSLMHEPQLLGSFHSRLYRRLREIYRHTYTRNDRRRYLLGRVRARLRSFSYSIALRKGLEEAVSAPRDVKEINHTAGVNYNLRPYPGRVTLFRAEEDHPMVKPLPLDLGWSSFAHSLAIKHIPGDHGGILYDPGLSILAAELTGTLEDANAAFDEAVPLEQAAQNTGRIVMEL
jgi:thioesterase domain-containing protein